MPVILVQMEPGKRVLAVVERVRTLGFSSDAEVIRLAILAWTDRPALVLAEKQAVPESYGLNSTDGPTARP